MSFLMPDLIATAVILERLEHLRQNPDHLTWMLLPFLQFQRLNEMVGPKHVKQCIEYIMSNKPLVRPYYDQDLAKLPSIVLASNQGEATQFIGQYGFETTAQLIDPEVIASCDAIKYEGEVVTFAVGSTVGDSVWPRLWAVSGSFASRVVSVWSNTEGVHVELQDSIPAGTTMKGWKFQTSTRVKHYSIGSSIDDVTVTITLSTAGDYSIQRLMATVLRYCLKSGRLLFDAYGLQVASFVQHPTVNIDEEQNIWQTGFVMECKGADHWVDSEYVTDDSAPTYLTVVAAQEPLPAITDVNLDEEG